MATPLLFDIPMKLLLPAVHLVGVGVDTDNTNYDTPLARGQLNGTHYAVTGTRKTLAWDAYVNTTYPGPARWSLIKEKIFVNLFFYHG